MEAPQHRWAPTLRPLLLFALGALFLVAWLLLTAVAAHADDGLLGGSPARHPRPAVEHAADLPSHGDPGRRVREVAHAAAGTVDRKQVESRLRRTAEPVVEKAAAVRKDATDRVRRTTDAVRDTVRGTVRDTTGRVGRTLRDLGETQPLPVPSPTEQVPALDAPAAVAPDAAPAAVAGERPAHVVPASSGQDGVAAPASTQPSVLASAPDMTVAAADPLTGSGLGSAGSAVLPGSGSVELPQRGAGGAAVDGLATAWVAAARQGADGLPDARGWFPSAPAFQPTVSPD